MFISSQDLLIHSNEVDRQSNLMSIKYKMYISFCSPSSSLDMIRATAAPFVVPAAIGGERGGRQGKLSRQFVRSKQRCHLSVHFNHQEPNTEFVLN